MDISNRKQEELKREIASQERARILEMEEKKVGLLSKLTEYVEKELIESRENAQERSKITFSKNPLVLETKGFRFNTFLVSENHNDTILEIEYDLERFNMVLTSGFNRLNFPDGTIIKTKENDPVSVSLILSKQQF